MASKKVATPEEIAAFEIRMKELDRLHNKAIESGRKADLSLKAAREAMSEIDSLTKTAVKESKKTKQSAKNSAKL